MILLVGIISSSVIFSLLKDQDNPSLSTVNSSEETTIRYQDNHVVFTSTFFENVDSGYTAILNRTIGAIDGGGLTSLCTCVSALTLNEYTPPENAVIICGGTYCFVLNFKNGEKAEFSIQGNVITVEASISGFEDLAGKQYEAVNSDESLVDMVMSYFRTADTE